jgi:hypothetical protein
MSPCKKITTGYNELIARSQVPYEHKGYPLRNSTAIRGNIFFQA